MSIVAVTSLIDELFADQQRFTAVERFSRYHSNIGKPAQAVHYEALIPLNRPGIGEQYRFEVDLDACSGCKACVTACHSLNGLDEGESWRDVGSLVSVEETDVAQQTVTTACHHCVDPACANGCPTLAYEKDSDTGIVRHLDDQCIGCQYCTLTCPYEVPKFNDRLGIVRKCDMCQGRLREGEAPACVQACPNEAIQIRIVSKAAIALVSQGTSLLPGTAPSRITQPSTSFLHLRSGLVPADGTVHRPAHAHTPLAVMLVLTQAAAGLLFFDVLSRLFSDGESALGEWHGALGAFFAVAGLFAATLHLGRPSQAWKSFLGWKKSWLSREILVFGPWAVLALSYVSTLFLPLADWMGVPDAFVLMQSGLALGAVGAGFLGVFCSIMVYAVTRRPLWSFPQTFTRFGLTLLILGSAFVDPILAALLLAGKLTGEMYLSHLRFSPFQRTARLLQGALHREWLLRQGFGVVGLATLFASHSYEFISGPAFLIVLTGELLERSLYFRAVDSPKMPGGIGS